MSQAVQMVRQVGHRWVAWADRRPSRPIAKIGRERTTIVILRNQIVLPGYARQQ